MKFFWNLKTPWIVAFCLLATGFVLPAQESISRVTARAGKTMIIRGAEFVPLEKEALVGVAKVMTNAVFKVKDGRERTLVEGQILGADGNLLNPDGSLVPVVDHVIVQGGRAVLVKDGESTPLGAEITLANGTRVLPDGTYITADGTRGKLLDGQMRMLDGGVIAAQDTVLLKDGRVIVQKDGSSFPVLPGRSLMMNDGTKVLGDGAVLKPDGTRIPLVEGQVLPLDGAK